MNKKLEPLNDKDWEKFQKYVKEQEIKCKGIGINLYTADLIINTRDEKLVEDKIKGSSNTTMCDEIEAESWKAMPISMKVNDFCNH